MDYSKNRRDRDNKSNKTLTYLAAGALCEVYWLEDVNIVAETGV